MYVIVLLSLVCLSTQAGEGTFIASGYGSWSPARFDYALVSAGPSTIYLMGGWNYGMSANAPVAIKSCGGAGWVCFNSDIYNGLKPRNSDTTGIDCIATCVGYSSYTGTVNFGYISTKGIISYTKVAQSLNDVWRSSDGGTSWTLMTSAAPWSSRSSFKSLALSTSSLLIWSTDMWRSTDSGVSWSLMTSPTGISAGCVMARVQINNLILASKYAGNLIIRSLS